MNKNERAKISPMGLNSWDCYGDAATEEETRGMQSIWQNI